MSKAGNHIGLPLLALACLAFYVLGTWVTALHAGGPHTIGYIGCSNSMGNVQGYHWQSAQDQLWEVYSTGGGSIDQWANPASSYWTQFDQQVITNGVPETVWVQVCEKSAQPYTIVVQALLNLRARVPIAQFVISGLNSYDPPNLCTVAWQHSQENAAQAVTDGWGILLADVGTLTPATTQGGGCHPSNPDGINVLGAPLVAFFDGGATLTPTLTPTPTSTESSPTATPTGESSATLTPTMMASNTPIATATRATPGPGTPTWTPQPTLTPMPTATP